GGSIAAKALSLGGTNGYVDVPDGLLTTARELTIAVWVNVTTARDWQRIFDFGRSNTTGYMFLTPQAMGAGLRFAITKTDNLNNAEQRLDAPVLPTATWTHVAVVLGPSGGAMFVGGVKVATNTMLTLR